MIEAWILAASVWVIPVLFAITLHEAAHGWAALKLGDDTALRLGRVTLNPIKHVHPVGTILLPGALIALGAPFVFGFAKPVPVNPARLRNPRGGMVLVALAGPGMNILLACVSAVLLHAATATCCRCHRSTAAAWCTGCCRRHKPSVSRDSNASV